MGVRVRYSDGSERWCESCADPNDNGGSVVQGGTEHNAGGGSLASPAAQAPNSAPQGPGGNGPAGTQAASATAQDRVNYPTFYNSGSPGTTGYAGPQGAAGGGTMNGVNYGGQPVTNNQAPDNATNPAGTPPKTNDQWAFDPTQPQRSISAAMSLLGLPLFGPAADFYTRYGMNDVSQALASGDFVSPDSYKNSLTGFLGGQAGGSGMGIGDMVRSLMGGENLAGAVTSGQDSQLAQYFQKDATGKWTPKAGMNPPTDLARAAYIANMEADPNAMSQMMTGTLVSGQNPMSSSVAGLLGAFLGNAAQRRYNSSVPQNDTMNFLGKLLGY